MRVFLAILGTVSAAVFTPWVTAIFMVILAARWRAWEVIAIGMIADILWFPSSTLWSIPLATFFGIVVVWLLEPLRNELLVDQPAL